MATTRKKTGTKAASTKNTGASGARKRAGCGDLGSKTAEEWKEWLTECMVAHGVYDETLDPMIWVLATLEVRFYQASNEASEGLVLEETKTNGHSKAVINPLGPLLVQLAEEIRKYKRDLGLAVAMPAGFEVRGKSPQQRTGDKLVNMLETAGSIPMKVYKKG